MRWLKIVAAALALVILLGAGAGLYLWRRALPQVEGTLRVQGIGGKVEIVRDRWGVPHVFAGNEKDAYFGLGWATAQDRLFHMELLRRLGQGRLAEIFGPDVVKVDRLFRTMGFHRAGQRMIAATRPEIRAANQAYQSGINAYVASLNGRLPIEFTLLGIGFAPVAADDFAGVIAFMTWNLNPSWKFDPLYEKLVEKVGPGRAAELFPSLPTPRPGAAALGPVRVRPDLFRLNEAQRGLLDLLSGMSASNNWVVGPKKSATGHAILANDPHLAHSLPGIWYQAHLSGGGLEVTGVTIPGLPLVVIGHNRDIAWGFTNLMADAGDFFLERRNPADATQVMYRGRWVTMRQRRETIAVKGEAPVSFTVWQTPHGPLVNDLLPGQQQALSYQWVLHAAADANEWTAFYDLNHARNWGQFRAALANFGAVAMNVAYADREGHIGMQAAGRIPRLTGNPEGTRFRRGWDGSQEWDGFHPFADNPFLFDPPQGWIATANNRTLPARVPFYISAYWEPLDRITRIREILGPPGPVSVETMQALHGDTVLLSARETLPLIKAAFRGHPPQEPALAAALEFLVRWDGDMAANSQAAAVYAVFYKHLFHELFDDELGQELTNGFREKANVSSIMIRAVLSRGASHWFDRKDTPAREERAEILRSTLRKAVAELEERLGDDPQDWRWGALHTLEFVHPLGRVAALAPFFNVGPFAVGGHANTVNKGEYYDKDFKVYHGPSMRQITDFSDLDGALAIIPTGQSGIPASPHYDDLAPLWLEGRYHPLPLSRAAVDKIAEARLVLEP